MVRYEAAYVLACHSEWARIATSALEEVAQNRREYAEIRGQALEALAWAYLFDAHRSKRVVAFLQRLLQDPEPEVRFWAVYALWTMRAKAAIPHLEGMVEDAGVGRMGWTVGQEAQDALSELRDGCKARFRVTPEGHWKPFAWQL